ncbi:PEP-CTERM sorting domain-containing protein [Tundrisphaera lichenicola]|uniref:PEP-CTERM sorting domain-containing protein n=1 Tax=Tundrisphaera lichenicola TaxID=2029860 RepID=UPI003EB78F9B
MSIGTLSPLAFAVTLLGSGLLMGSANASMFSVTNLGYGFTFQQDPSGVIHSVTSSDGSRSYTFEKSPATEIHEGDFTNSDSYHWHYNTVYLLQNGAYKTGYSEDIRSTSKVPSDYYILGDWSNIGGSPVLDINSHGEIVGQSSDSRYHPDFAAFSDPTGHSHIDSGLFGQNNLNDYVASDLGVVLTSAVKVDDFGRIIAVGTLNGVYQDFLLTPDGVASIAIPTPEPSLLTMMTIALVGVAFRRVIKRRSPKSELPLG